MNNYLPLTGQGSLPLFLEKLSAKALASGVNENVDKEEFIFDSFMLPLLSDQFLYLKAMLVFVYH